ncbi:MAG: magnesium/cobalt transporter CorA [Planctomycetota bacterium]
MGAKTRRRKTKARFQHRTEPGAPPGTIVPDPDAPRSDMHVIAYDAEGHVELQIRDPREITPLLEKYPVTWVHVESVADTGLVYEFGQLFKLHRLALEDVVHVHQRAKAESYGSYYFIVARMPEPNKTWVTEQISFFLSDRFVLTFGEWPGPDCLEPVRARVRTGWGRSRAARPDYLVYALLDAIVDHYFPLVEDCGERLDAIEADVMEGPARDVMPRVHVIKRDMLTVRRAIWPLRDAINVLLRDTTPLISDETRIYLRDLHDHTIQIVDLVESYRDISSGLTDVYLSSVSQRTNEIVKVLTVISTIFMPLTFIVGLYGMNFDTDASPWNMPELHWYWGYPLVSAVMVAVTAGMLLFFYRRGWLRRGSTEPKRDQEP